jgi:hypothetical protein
MAALVKPHFFLLLQERLHHGLHLRQQRGAGEEVSWPPYPSTKTSRDVLWVAA